MSNTGFTTPNVLHVDKILFGAEKMIFQMDVWKIHTAIKDAVLRLPAWSHPKKISSMIMLIIGTVRVMICWNAIEYIMRIA